MPFQPVHTGFWIDHSKGTILGGTLTYESQWGAQLISAATVLVQLTGAAIWTMVAFWLHQKAAGNGLRDEYDAQKSIIIRNSGNLTAILDILGLGRTWHKHAPRAWQRTIATIFLPLIIYLGFLVAGVMVGQIAINPQNSDALLAPETCGYVQTTSGSAPIYYILNNVSHTADSYARDCYAQNDQAQVQCSAYAKPNISYTTSSSASCPIGQGNCGLSGNSAVNFTVEFNSHEDLGINAKPEDRLTYGYSATCAPVSRELIESFTTKYRTFPLEAFGYNYSLYGFNFGRNNLYNVNAFNYTDLQVGLGTLKYELWGWNSDYPHNESGREFSPYAPFNETTGDVNIQLVIPNGVTYLGSSSDPVFGTGQTPDNVTGYYYPAYLVSFITCVENYRMCKSGSAECTPWSGYTAFTENSQNTLNLNPEQNATNQRFLEISSQANIYQATSIGMPLRASDQLLSGTLSAELPDNQWYIECESWFQAILAKAQYLTQAYTSIPQGLLDYPGIQYVPPDSLEEQAQCYQQRIQMPGGYQSYNVFALVFILFISIIVIGLALLLQLCHHRLPQRRPGQKNYVKLLTHFADGHLQLHRMALEGVGLTGWKDCNPGPNGKGGDIPYTEVATKRVPPPTSVVQVHKSDSFDSEMLRGDSHTVVYDKGLVHNSTHLVGGRIGDGDEAASSLMTKQ